MTLSLDEFSMTRANEYFVERELPLIKRLRNDLKMTEDEVEILSYYCRDVADAMTNRNRSGFDMLTTEAARERYINVLKARLAAKLI